MAEWWRVQALKLPKIAAATNWKAWLLTAISATMAWGLLLGSISLGLQTPSTRVWPHSQGGRLDYISRPFSAFAQLTSAFVSRTLGLGSSEGIGVTTGLRSDSGPTSRRGVIVEHPFDNDQFESARDIRSLPLTAKTNTTGSTRQDGEPSNCAPVGGTVWYRLPPQTAEIVSVTTVGSSYSTSLGVFAGTALSNLRSVGCDSSDTGDSWVNFKATSGTTYYFQITGPVSGGGSLSLTVDLHTPGSMVSISKEGQPGDLYSDQPSISADGRYVVFYSQANNLAEEDKLIDDTDVFVRDRLTKTTSLASVSASGQPGNSTSFAGLRAMSEDGRYVAFLSYASNLVPGDTNKLEDIFVRDLVTPTTFRVSVSSAGQQGTHAELVDCLKCFVQPAPAASISADGRFVAFHSWHENLVENDRNLCPEYEAQLNVKVTASGCPDIFVRDVVAKTTTRVSVSSWGLEGNGASYMPIISADGRYVSFYSYATNLVPNDTNGFGDIFVHDRLARRTTRVSVSSSGEQQNKDTKVWRRTSLSADGRYVAFASDASNLAPNDTNEGHDIFVHDQLLGVTNRVNVSSKGEQATLGSDSRQPSFSPDGRYIAFESDADNLVANDTNGVKDIFLHDLYTRTTIRLSETEAGGQGNGGSFSPSLSADGRFVTFSSEASNFVPWDKNQERDIFVFPVRIYR